MGVALSALGRSEEAIKAYNNALQITRELGDLQGEGTILVNLGNVYSSLSQYDKAIEYNAFAAGIFDKTKSPSVNTTRRNILKINELKKITTSEFNFHAPLSMTKGSPVYVTFDVAARGDIKSRIASTSNPGKNDLKTIDRDRMKVKIVGGKKDVFQIVKISSEIQAVPYVDSTIWKWSVTPMESGKHSLNLPPYCVS